MKPDLQAIRERAENATTGPWNAVEDSWGYAHINSNNGERVFEDLDAPNGEDIVFIANARTDIPALLDYIERLEAVNRWIPVDDSPEQGQYVWCINTNWHVKHPILCQYDYDDSCDDCIFKDANDPTDEIESTHWMPLPEPPLANLDGDV